MSKPILTQSRLRELFDYNPETGVFTRRISKGSRAWAGKTSGNVSTSGDVQLFIDGKLRAAHRMAWLYVYGILPTHCIDHINGSRADNRIVNLRDVTFAENCQNKRASRSDSTTGLIGVSPHGSSWRARIQIGSTRKNLGTFATAHLAYAAYLTAKRQLHTTCTI